jgi:serpin B
MGTVAGCWAAEKPATNEKTDTEVIVEGANKFAFELYAQLRAKEEGNLFFSPYSISTALAMTCAGARGQTEAQMARVLNFPTVPSDDPNEGLSKSTEQIWDRMRVHSAFGEIIKDLNARGEKGDYQLAIANALWGQKGYGFLIEFLELIKNNYGGQFNEVDFKQATEAARQTINTWVEKQTNGKIKDLISRGVLSNLTRLVLTNAIYFKGNWASQFEEDKTKEAPFTLINGEKIDVAMMNQTGQFKYMETETFQALELPYVDEQLSMIILLPKEIDGLVGLEEMLTGQNLSDWLAQLSKRKVIVSIPKFKMTCQFRLAQVLKSMGMMDAFSLPPADFSGMNGKRDLFVSAVIHKAYVEVNEEGTEAAAATAVVVGITAVRPEAPVFRADHPFLFLIRDNYSGSILFIGRAMNPST